MRLLQCIKRLVVFAFVIEVTSHPTPYGSRLINFLGSGAVVGAKPIVSCGNNNNKNNNDGNCLNSRHRHHNQKNIGTGSDSSLVEISFQPLKELESVSPLTSFYPLARKQFFLNNDDDDDPSHQALPVGQTKPHPHQTKNSHTHSYRQRRTGPRHHQPIDNIENNNDDDVSDDNFQTYQQRYPDQATLSSIEGPTTAFTPVVGNGNPYPLPAPNENDETEEAEDPFGFMHRETQNSIRNGGDSDTESFPWDVFKEKSSHPAGKDLTIEVGQSYIDSTDVNNKRNALAAFKRQKFKTHQSQFAPSISGGAVAGIRQFFENFRNNVEFMHKSRLSNSEEVLLEGEHPLQMIKEELLNGASNGGEGGGGGGGGGGIDGGDGSLPPGTAAFLHAIRNYRPSQRIRSLVALNPEGYHGTQFLDPNYMWLGLGKR